MVDTNLLADVELFRALSPEAFGEVAAAARTRTLRRGDVLAPGAQRMPRPMRDQRAAPVSRSREK